MTTTAVLTPPVIEAVNAFRNLAWYERFSTSTSIELVYRTECKLFEIFNLFTAEDKEIYSSFTLWLANTGLDLADPTTEELFTVFNTNNQ